MLQTILLLVLANAPETLGWELTRGVTGIALGMVIASVGMFIYRVRYELPRLDAQAKENKEVKDAVYEMSRSIWVLISGSENHTDASKEEARKGIARIDSKTRHNT